MITNIHIQALTLIRTMQTITKATKENLERMLQENRATAEQLEKEKGKSFNILA